MNYTTPKNKFNENDVVIIKSIREIKRVGGEPLSLVEYQYSGRKFKIKSLSYNTRHGWCYKLYEADFIWPEKWLSKSIRLHLQKHLFSI